MAKTVIELAHRQLFCLTADTPAATALDRLRRLSLHGAPVVDEVGRPVGVVTMMDLVGSLEGRSVGDRMSFPAEVVAGHVPIADVARALVERGRHHVVVCEAGRAVGFVSAVDLLAGVLGVSPRRPATLPLGLDGFGLQWSEVRAFDAEGVQTAPAHGGIIAWVHGGAFRTEQVVWAEQASDVRARLEQLLNVPSCRPSIVQQFTGWGSLRFCVAVVTDAEQREAALQDVQAWRTRDAAPTVHELLGHRRVDA